jgi:hypothetical protein
VSAQIVEFIAEIGQRRKLRRDRSDLRFEERALLGGGSGELPLQRGGVAAKPVEQEGERSPRHADGGVHENGVDRRVIDLHAELFHEHLAAELESIVAGERGVDGEPRGIEHELVLGIRALHRAELGANRGGGDRPLGAHGKGLPHHQRLDIGVAHHREPGFFVRADLNDLVDQIAFSAPPQLPRRRAR